MRRFNPEKELKKIQHGNKNKVIFTMLFGILLLTIGYSFALYQVRYSKRIIYTKVAPFSSHDLDLAIYVDGSKVEKVPEKGKGYYYESITCESDPDAIAGWDYTNWKLGAISVTIPNKCNINFTTHPTTLIDLIDYDYHNNPETVIEDETTDKNLRYIGENPNNYIWFNCDSYDDLNQETAKTKCEKWRVIGLMNNMTLIDKTTQEKIPNQSLIKIIRSNKIGEIAWDGSNTNNWTRPATLQTGLNGPYLNNSDSGNWITSTAYAGSLGSNTKDVSYKGITSTTRNMIEKVTWNLGRFSYSNNTASQFYTYEREGSTWDGYIGLMYPSDYGYAAPKSCWSTILGSGGYNESCYNSDWLYLPDTTEWTITTSPDQYSRYVYTLRSGFINEPDWAFGQFAVRPSLYLNTSVQVKNGGGIGSFSDPYILVP